MNSTELMQHECQIYVILGGRLEQPSLFVRVCLILNIIINIFTFPFTAVLNALVIIAVKTKRRLRAHKSNIAIALLATTDFVAGSFAQPVFIAWLILILVNYNSDFMPISCVSLPDKHAFRRIDSSSADDKWRAVFSHQASICAHLSCQRK